MPRVVDGVLQSPGQPLERGTREFMESRLGHDFSRVRVHTDSRAAESAKAVHAHAYTVGQDVVFASGQFAPETAQGRKLIAHELAHTIQQRNGTADRFGAKGISRVDDPLEREADRAAALLDSDDPATFSTHADLQLSRDLDDSDDSDDELPGGSSLIPTGSGLDPCKVNAVFLFAPAGPEKANCLVPDGQYGASSLARYRVTGVPSGTTLTIGERFKALEDPYSVISRLKPNTYTTSDLKFDDCYMLASPNPLPTDFVLKVEQNHLLDGQPISKNIITFTPNHVLMRFCSRLKDSCGFSDVCRLK